MSTSGMVVRALLVVWLLGLYALLQVRPRLAYITAALTLLGAAIWAFV